MEALPPAAAWRHHGRAELPRDGFEVVAIEGRTFRGSTSLVEAGVAVVVAYELVLDEAGRTRSARVSTLDREIVVTGDGEGRWQVDGVHVPAADGCLDVDLESSSLTNAFPVRRLGLAPGAAASAPALYVRQDDLAVERLEQRYEHLGDRRYAYASPGFTCEIAYDASGLALEYPGIASRVALEAP